ncbi:MAG: M48 family metallopeptidase [Haloferacaceae archaeon]
MRRTVGRLAMGVVGGVSLFVYVAAAVALYSLFRAAWADRPSATTVVVGLVAITLAVGYLTYRGGSARLLAEAGGRELVPSDAPRLFARLDRVCERMGIERPPLLVADLGEPNAFAVGDVREGAVVVDEALLRMLSLDEFVAVVAHEYGHLQARDGLVQVLATTALQTVVTLLMVALLPVVLVITGAAKAVAWTRGTPAAWTETTAGRLRGLVFGLVMVAPTVVTLVLLAHSRRREYAADDRAAAVTGDPRALARALRRIDDAAREELLLRGALLGDPDAHPVLRLLATHPAIERRVQRLERMAGSPQSRSG